MACLVPWNLQMQRPSLGILERPLRPSRRVVFSHPGAKLIFGIRYEHAE